VCPIRDDTWKKAHIEGIRPLFPAFFSVLPAVSLPGDEGLIMALVVFFRLVSTKIAQITRKKFYFTTSGEYLSQESYRLGQRMAGVIIRNLWMRGCKRRKNT